MTPDSNTPCAKPKASFVMPCYDATKYLVASIGSVLAQTIVDWELVAVDDGSTDDTFEVLTRFAALDPRIRPVRLAENVGVAAALNEGLKAARGDWIARLDADDLATPDRLAQQHALAARDVVLVAGRSQRFSGEGEFRPVSWVPTSHNAILRTLVMRHSAFAHSTVMFRREVALKVGGYDPRMTGAEDLDLWLRLARVGTLCAAPQMILHYRVHPGQVTAQYNERIRVIGMCSVVRYLLVTKGGKDPLRTNGDWDRFYAWVQERMLREGLLAGMQRTHGGDGGGFASAAMALKRARMSSRLAAEWARNPLW